MGCTISTIGEMDPQRNREIWELAESKEKHKVDAKLLKSTHHCWRTVRLFVSSTFKDFRSEREWIHAKLYPALQKYCLDRHIILILEEMTITRREALDDPEYTYASMDAIENGYEDNGCPFYLCLLGECAGYVPPIEYLDNECVRYFDIPRGLSRVEMEITIAAHKVDNPFGLFMARDPAFAEAIPFHKVQFIDDEDGRKRMQFVKQKLWQSIPVQRFSTYHCESQGIEDRTHGVQFIKLHKLEGLMKTSQKFFVKNIDKHFKYVAPTDDEWPSMHLASQRRAVSRAAIARGDLITQVMHQLLEHITTGDVPRVGLSGDAGVGKTSILANLVTHCLPDESTTESVIECASKKGQPFKVFYHFVTHTKDGRNVTKMMQRMLQELYGVDWKTHGKLSDVEALLIARLTNPDGPPVLIIIDDVDTLANTLNTTGWLATPLPAHVRIVMTFAKDSNIPRECKQLEQPLNWIRLAHLDKADVKFIFNKWMRYVPRGFVPGCHTLEQTRGMERPQTAKRRTADDMANLTPITTSKSKAFTVDTTATVTRRLWSAGVRAVNTQSLTAKEQEFNRSAISSSDGKKTSLDDTMKSVKIHDIENGADAATVDTKVRKVEYTACKCQMLASMLKQGMSLDKVKALAYFNTNSVADVELSDIEANAHGHIVIAMLCYLCVAQNGMREVELRELMADEETMLPVGIKRHSKVGMHFAFGSGAHGQVTPLRYRLALLRIKHHLVDIGEPGENRMAIGCSACRKAVWKRWLSKTERHWRRKLVEYFDRTDAPYLDDRRCEEMPTHLRAATGVQLNKAVYTKLLSEWPLIDMAYHPEYSEQLVRLWQIIGDAKQLESPYMETIFKKVEHASNTANGTTELVASMKKLVNIFMQVGVYASATKMLAKAIEVESGATKEHKPDMVTLGDLHRLQGEIHHFTIVKSNEFVDWVSWDDLSRISYVIAAFEAAIEQYAKAKEQTDGVKKSIALCKYRLAFWHMVQAAHVSSGSQAGARSERSLTESQSAQELNKSTVGKPFKTAAKYAKDAQDAFHDIKEYKWQGLAYLLRAQCEMSKEKVIDHLSKAHERIVKEDGPNSPALLKYYGVAIKLTRPDHLTYAEKATELIGLLCRATDKQRYADAIAQLNDVQNK